MRQPRTDRFVTVGSVMRSLPGRRRVHSTIASRGSERHCSGMTEQIDARTLKSWLSDGAEIALIDVREAGQFGEAHPFFAIPLPYSRFELALPQLAPSQSVRLVL